MIHSFLPASEFYGYKVLVLWQTFNAKACHKSKTLNIFSFYLFGIQFSLFSRGFLCENLLKNILFYSFDLYFYQFDFSLLFSFIIFFLLQPNDKTRLKIAKKIFQKYVKHKLGLVKHELPLNGTFKKEHAVLKNEICEWLGNIVFWILSFLLTYSVVMFLH